MTDKKGIQPKRTFSEYVNKQRYLSNPFGQNISADQAFGRAERILCALYLLTNVVPSSEPLRANIRAAGHCMIEQILALRAGFRSADTDVNAVLATLREAASLSWMLYVGGYISRSNVEILNKAIDELGQFIAHSSGSQLAEDIHLELHDFAAVQRAASYSEPPAAETPNESPGKRGVVFKRTDISKGQKSKRTATHKNREALILDLLRKRGGLGIKDISLQVVGCSEKTVQRELGLLISQGLVRKEGSKRWSKYFVV